MVEQNKEPLILSAQDALSILNAVDCIVTLHIALGEYKTKHGLQGRAPDFLVYVIGYEDLVHIRNIASIKMPNSTEFAPIDWSTLGDTSWIQE